MLTQLINCPGAPSHKWHINLLKFLFSLGFFFSENKTTGNSEPNLEDFCLPYSSRRDPRQDHHVSPRPGDVAIRTPAVCTFSLTVVFHMAIWIQQKMCCWPHFLLLGPILEDLTKWHGMSWIGGSKNAEFQIMLKQSYWERSQQAEDCHISIQRTTYQYLYSLLSEIF